MRSASTPQTSHRFPKAQPILSSHRPSAPAHLWLYCLALQFIWKASALRGLPCASWHAELFWIISLKSPDATCLLPIIERVIKADWCLLNALLLLHDWMHLLICISVMMSYAPRPLHAHMHQHLCGHRLFFFYPVFFILRNVCHISELGRDMTKGETWNYSSSYQDIAATNGESVF